MAQPTRVYRVKGVIPMRNQFAIEQMAKVTVTNVKVRSETHGDEHVPAVDISVKLSTSNLILSEFDAALRGMLYQKPAKGAEAPQATLEGVEAITDLPMLRSTMIKMPLALKHEFVGYTLTVDYGLGGSANIVVGECEVNKFGVDCKEGGTVDLAMRIQAAKLTGDVIGKLATLIGCETSITLTPPEEKQAPIDGTVRAFNRDVAKKGGGEKNDPPAGGGKKGAPAKDATAAFLETQGADAGAGPGAAA